TYLCPGLRFFHQGQMDGFQKKIPVHLGRGPVEHADARFENFYERLFSCLRDPKTHDGEWQLLECRAAWDGNWTSDCFISFAWRGSNGTSLIVTVNYAENQSQCYVGMPFHEVAGKHIRLLDLMGDALFSECGDELLSRGLYLDLPPWGYHVFELT